MARFPRLELLLQSPVQSWTERELKRAVQDRVREDYDLDFKRQPYGTNKGADLAADVAAMLNVGGGVLVIGVRDEESTAAGLAPFADVAVHADRIRSWLAELVTPVPRGVTLRRIASEADPDSGYLLVLVPASPDVPHAVRNGVKWLGYPVRNADQTRWMSESEIAARYRDRGASVASRLARLDVITQEGLAALARRAWLYVSVAVVPLMPGRAAIGSMGVEDVKSIVTQRLYFPSPLAISAAVRPGLRKVQAIGADGGMGLADDGLVELHEDGAGFSVVDIAGRDLAAAGMRNEPGNFYGAYERYVQASVIGALDVLARHASLRARCSGDAAIRVTLGLTGAAGFATLSERHPMSGEWRRAGGGQAVPRNEPVVIDSVIDLDAVVTSPRELVLAAREVLLHLFAAFGVELPLAVTPDGRLRAAAFGQEAASVKSWAERADARDLLE